jgi:2-dehydro-3-deoxy-D-gluconate 5-dehydrogenase
VTPRPATILDAFRLDGKVALVTGAGRGLGLGITTALAEAGADLAVLDRSGAPASKELVTGLGRNALQLTVDLAAATTDDLRDVVEQVHAAYGRLDILVNNAGTIRRTPALEFSETEWDEVLQVNLKSAFFLSQAAARAMKHDGAGKIINIASMLSFQGGILIPSYTASKSGLAGITRALAAEWAGLGINVNAIAPGYFATDNTAPLRADRERSGSILARIPAGRWGEADDLMGVTVFLASDASSYVHGSVIPVDGGWLVR